MQWIKNQDGEIVWDYVDRLRKENPDVNYVVGAPRGSEVFSIERLQKMNVVGIYEERGISHAV